MTTPGSAPRLIVTTRLSVLDEDRATEFIRSDGYPFVFTLDTKAEDNEPHWHTFGTKIMLLSGSMTLWDDETGRQYECTAGTFVETNGMNLHHERHDGYRAVIGFDTDPATLTRPIKRAPADRAVLSAVPAR
jgi:hypothetical protein